MDEEKKALLTDETKTILYPEKIHTTASNTISGLNAKNEYDASRLKKKVGNWIAFFFAVKGTASLVFFTSQFSFGLAGYILGIVS